MAGERHERGMGTACCVWIGLYCTNSAVVSFLRACATRQFRTLLVRKKLECSWEYISLWATEVWHVTLLVTVTPQSECKAGEDVEESSVRYGTQTGRWSSIVHSLELLYTLAMARCRWLSFSRGRAECAAPPVSLFVPWFAGTHRSGSTATLKMEEPWPTETS
jgi:hypothetical protein